MFRSFLDLQDLIHFVGVICNYCAVCVADLGIGGEGCRKTRTRTWVGKHVTGKAKTEIHTVLVERGLSWTEIQEKWAELTGDLEGFYISHQVCIVGYMG